MDVTGAIEVMGSCQIMGQIVAAAIVRDHPELAEREQAIGETCATEVFLAVKDMGEAFRHEAFTARLEQRRRAA